MKDTISNTEAIEIMNRCKREIIDLRAAIDRLKPKADAYDNLVIVLRLLPQLSEGMREDLIWRLNERIRELEPKPIDPPN